MENRLRVIRKKLEMTQEALAQRLGIGKSALSMIETGKAALSERNRNILINEFGVNSCWLESGHGEMFIPDFQQRTPPYRRDGADRAQCIPLYNVDSRTGLTAVFADSDAVAPADFIHIPNMPRCDGAVYLTGESMYPLLRSGDIVIYKQLHDMNDIFWGDMYLLSIEIGGEEYITVKYLFRSERNGCVRMSGSAAPGSDPGQDKDIETSRIRAIAFVKASVRFNTPG